MTLLEQVARKHNEVHNGKHDKEQAALLEGQQSNVGKPDVTEEEHDNEQANSTALLESRDGKAGGAGTGSKAVKEKFGNEGQQSTLSNVMSWRPHPLTAGVQAAICLAGVLVLFWVCSCCLFARTFFSEKNQLEGSRSRGGSTGGRGSAEGRMRQDSGDLEEEGLPSNEYKRSKSNSSQKSTCSSRASGKIAGLLSKGKRARGVSEAETYKFGDVARGFLST